MMIMITTIIKFHLFFTAWWTNYKLKNDNSASTL